MLLREENLVTAESQRIAALRIYHGSVTALDRAQGTLLEDRSIVLEDALPAAVGSALLWSNPA